MKGLTYALVVLTLALFGVGASVALADSGNGNGGNPPGPVNQCGPSEHGVYDASGVFQGCEHNGGGSGNCGQNQSGNGGDHGYGNDDGCIVPPPPTTTTTGPGRTFPLYQVIRSSVMGHLDENLRVARERLSRGRSP